MRRRGDVPSIACTRTDAPAHGVRGCRWPAPHSPSPLVCAVAAWRPWVDALRARRRRSTRAPSRRTPRAMLTLPDAAAGARLRRLVDLRLGGDHAHARLRVPTRRGPRAGRPSSTASAAAATCKPGIDGGCLRRAHRRARPRRSTPTSSSSRAPSTIGACTPTGYRDAVTAAWDTLAALYPDAAVVDPRPRAAGAPGRGSRPRASTRTSRSSPRRAAGGTSPPIAEDWITPENYLAVIDTSEIGRDHPSTAGHAYLAERVAARSAGMTESDRGRRRGPPRRGRSSSP